MDQFPIEMLCVLHRNALEHHRWIKSALQFPDRLDNVWKPELDVRAGLKEIVHLELKGDVRMF